MNDLARLRGVELQLQMLYVQTNRLIKEKRRLAARLDKAAAIRAVLSRFEPPYRESALRAWKAARK